MRKAFFVILVLCLLVGVVSADNVLIYSNFNTNLKEDDNGEWSTFHGGDGTSVVVPTTQLTVYALASSIDQIYTYNIRVPISFGYNATMPAGSTVTGATLYVYGYLKYEVSGTANLSIIDYTGTNPAAAVDYDSTTFTRQASDLAYGSFVTGGVECDYSYQSYSDQYREWKHHIFVCPLSRC